MKDAKMSSIVLQLEGCSWVLTSITFSRRVALRLERLLTVPKTMVRDPPGTIGWKLANCPPGSKWRPGENTGEIKAARKGTGHPTSQYRWPNVRIVYGTYLNI